MLQFAHLIILEGGAKQCSRCAVPVPWAGRRRLAGMLESAFGESDERFCPVRLLRGFEIFSRFALFQFVNISG